ncbi:MAG: carboxypeptidase-like regulatory domain-containing protein, partial [Ferruginibacter sp.]
MKFKKRLRQYGLIMFLILFNHVIFGQAGTVTGKVMDATGNQLAGVTVAVKGKQNFVTTATNGSFSVKNVVPGDVLLFSSVGFNSIEQKIGSASNLSITLPIAPGNLNEVVVIGYGSSRKKDLTGSVATVSSKDFQKGQISTPEQMIAGKLPGVSIISNGGQPGSGSTIRIRGGSSIRASNDPLIVI